MDASTIWSTLMNNSNIKGAAINTLAQTLLKGVNKSEYAQYITILTSLYSKYKGSANSQEVSAANLANQLSTVVKGLQTADAAKGVFSKLKGLFGK